MNLRIWIILSINIIFLQIAICGTLIKKTSIDTIRLNELYSSAKEYSRNNSVSAFKTLDSIEFLLQKYQYSIGYPRFYNIKGAFFLDQYKYDSAQFYLNKAYNLRKIITDKDLIYNILSNKALLYLKTDSVKLSLSYFKVVFNYYTKTKNEKHIAKTALNLSNIYKRMTQLDSAYYYNNLSHRIFTKIKDTTGIIFCGNSLGVLLSEMGFFKESISLFRGLWALDTVYDGLYFLPTIYLNLGDIYSRHLNLNDSAIFFLNKSFEEATKMDNKFMIQASKVNISNVYFNTKEYNKIIDILKENLNSEFGTIRVSSLINTGIALKELKKDSASFYLAKGINSAKALKLTDFQMVGLRHLYQFDSIKADFRAAFMHYQQYISLKDTINNQTNQELINSLEAKFESEKQIQEKEFWKKQNLMNLELLKKKSTLNQLMILLFVALILILISVIVTRIKTKKHNNELLMINKKLSESNEELQKINEMKNTLFSILSHDLKSNIGPSNQLLHILTETDNEMDESEKKTILNAIVKTSDNVKNLLNNLLEWIRIQHNTDQFKTHQINLKQVIQTILEQQINGLNNLNLEIDNEIEDEIFLCTNEDILRTIMRNLLSNAIKFTPKKGQIKIHSKIEGEFINIIVSDTGVGMTSETITKIFDYKERFTSLGVNNEGGSGLGLKLTRQLTEMIGGKITAESSLNHGSSFTIYLPMMNMNCD
jgi:signal transduction histidine kinase